jgi:class 3 adenylate cyclase
LRRKLVAILAADVVGYSRMMGRDEETTLAALSTHRDALAELIGGHGGRVFGSAGDSVMAEFPSAVEAVRCAIEWQRAMDGRNADVPEERRMRFRIGVNLGDVIVEGDNLFGDGVNVAARLEGLAEPGGICLSGTVFDHVKGKVIADYESLGERRLKNIDEPVRVYRLQLAQGAPADAGSVSAAEGAEPTDPNSAAVSAGRGAIKRHDWSAAVAHFREADAIAPLAPPDLETLAEALWWCGRIDESNDILERAYALYVKRQNTRRAAVVCMTLAENFFHRLASSVANGWFRRAEHLLAEEADSLEHAYLIRFQTRVALERQGDLNRALELAERTSRLATAFHDRNLQMLALHDRGCVLLAMGRVEDGLALMEEALVAAMAGELSPRVTGRIYCNMIDSCGKLADYRRAGEWAEEARRWCGRVGHNSGFPGICRIRSAELMRLRGSLTEAEEEARRACGELKDFLDFAGRGLLEIGEIQIMKGNLAGAEDAFRQAHELGADPQPGLAKIRLAQGNAEAARSLVERALADEALTRLDRAQILPLRVKTAVAMGDLDKARSASKELRAIADDFGSRALKAAAFSAEGAVQLAEGEIEGAAESWRRACALWRESGLPYEEARCRMHLGMVYRAQKAHDSAELELRAARSVFERLGAALDLRRLAEEMSEDRPPS